MYSRHVGHNSISYSVYTTSVQLTLGMISGLNKHSGHCKLNLDSLGELRNLVSIFGRQSDNGISLEQVLYSSNFVKEGKAIYVIPIAIDWY